MKKDHVDPIEILKQGLNMAEVAQLKKASAVGKSAVEIARYFRVEVKLVNGFLKHYKKDIDAMRQEAKARGTNTSMPKAKQSVLENRIAELEQANKGLIENRNAIVASNKELAAVNSELAAINLELVADKEQLEADKAQLVADKEQLEADAAKAATED